VSSPLDILREITGTSPSEVPSGKVTNGSQGSVQGAASPIRVVEMTPTPESRVVIGADHNDPVREQFRFVAHRLRKLRESKPMRCILVTSAAPKEGKTVVAVNLAVTLASATQRVLLIDGDLRASGREGLFGMADARGLAEVLDGRATIRETITFLQSLGIYYIPSGQRSSNPSELISAARAADLTATLDEFSWIVIDSPPVGAFADALSLAALCDTIVLVARSGFTRRSDLKETRELLKDFHIAGVIINACDAPRKGYYSYYDQKSGPRASRASLSPKDMQ
jgi:capsular exopolysaccharide synthesis family protein